MPAEWTGWTAGKANVRFQKFFFPCFCIHSQSKIYFFQKHVLPTPYLSKNSWCVHISITNIALFLNKGASDMLDHIKNKIEMTSSPSMPGMAI